MVGQRYPQLEKRFSRSLKFSLDIDDRYYRMNTRPNYECKLYIGSVHHRTNKPFFQPDVEVFCGEAQKDYEFIVPIRITPTTFISSTNYREGGWEIAAIDYPKLDFSPKQIRLFMLHLADKLLTQFKQNTICLIDNETIEMIT